MCVGTYLFFFIGILGLTFRLLGDGADINGLISFAFFLPVFAFLGGLAMTLMSVYYNHSSKNGNGIKVVVKETLQSATAVQSKNTTPRKQIVFHGSTPGLSLFSIKKNNAGP